MLASVKTGRVYNVAPQNNEFGIKVGDVVEDGTQRDVVREVDVGDKDSVN